MPETPTAEMIERVRALREAGKPLTAIAAELGWTKGRVSGLWRRHVRGGVKPPKIMLKPPVEAKPPPPPPPPPRPGQPCQFPLGHPGKPGFRFCDAPAKAGKVYCPKHCRVCYLSVGTQTAMWARTIAPASRTSVGGLKG